MKIYVVGKQYLYDTIHPPQADDMKVVKYEDYQQLQQENEHWKAFARWVAEELFNWSLSPEEWEGLQKEFEELTEKEGSSIKETKGDKRKEIIEKLEQILDILYDE